MLSQSLLPPQIHPSHTLQFIDYEALYGNLHTRAPSSDHLVFRLPCRARRYGGGALLSDRGGRRDTSDNADSASPRSPPCTSDTSRARALGQHSASVEETENN